jgi:beta-glucosidase
MSKTQVSLSTQNPLCLSIFFIAIPAVFRILLQMFTMGLFDHPNFNSRASNVTSVQHNDLARKLSAASTVLLKNSNLASKAAPLPLLKQGQRIAFIGRASDNCFTHSGGSGSVQPSRVVTPLQGATQKISSSSITYVDGSDIAAAAAAAKAADVAVVFAGTTSSEGYDRQDLNLDDNLDALISAVAAAQPNTVAVLSVPGAIVMPWSEVGCSAVVCGTAFVNCF